MQMKLWKDLRCAAAAGAEFGYVRMSPCTGEIFESWEQELRENQT